MIRTLKPDHALPLSTGCVPEPCGYRRRFGDSFLRFQSFVPSTCAFLSYIGCNLMPILRLGAPGDFTMVLYLLLHVSSLMGQLLAWSISSLAANGQRTACPMTTVYRRPLTFTFHRMALRRVAFLFIYHMRPAACCLHGLRPIGTSGLAFPTITIPK